MIQASLPHSNGAAAHANRSWLRQTVQQFFQQINWEDHPPEIHILRQPTAEGQDPSLSLLLTVNQFFSAINWEGHSVAMSPNPIAESFPITDSTTEETDPFTLEDFSGLF